jgi:ATP-dependent Clp protease ATP-binding subunit ClpA
VRSWKHLQSKLAEAVEHVLPPEEPKYWERYRYRAKEVVLIAKAEAKRDEMTPTTGYLLLGLLREEDADSQTFLRQLGVDTQELLDYVEEHVIEIQEPPHSVQPWLSAEGHCVLQIAIQEALVLGFAKVDTLHLMLGLVMAEETWAAQVLKHRGVNSEAIRAYIVQVYGHSLLQPSAPPVEAETLLRLPAHPEIQSHDLLRVAPEDA